MILAMNFHLARHASKIMTTGLISSFFLLPLCVNAEDKAAAEKKAKTGGLINLLLNQQKKKAMTQATSNAKQLFVLMVEFDQDFGSFPNDETAEAYDDLKLYQGTYSNDYLGQLIAGKFVKSEDVFFAKGGTTAERKPDNDVSTREKTLQGGECGFAYIKDQSSSNISQRPLLCAPMTGKGFKFNPNPYNGKAMVLHIDGSVKYYPINRDGDVILPNGKKLFEGGKETVWGVDGLKKGMLVFPKPV